MGRPINEDSSVRRSFAGPVRPDDSNRVWAILKSIHLTYPLVDSNLTEDTNHPEITRPFQNALSPDSTRYNLRRQKHQTTNFGVERELSNAYVLEELHSPPNTKLEITKTAVVCSPRPVRNKYTPNRFAPYHTAPKRPETHQTGSLPPTHPSVRHKHHRHAHTGPRTYAVPLHVFQNPLNRSISVYYRRCLPNLRWPFF